MQAFAPFIGSLETYDVGPIQVSCVCFSRRLRGASAC